MRRTESVKGMRQPAHHMAETSITNYCVPHVAQEADFLGDPKNDSPARFEAKCQRTWLMSGSAAFLS